MSAAPLVDEDADRAAIATVVRTFFAAFVSGPEGEDRLRALREILLPEAVIVRTSGPGPVVYDVDEFIEPRRVLLTGGTLTEFREWEESGRTDVTGAIAQHWSQYAKAGVQDGRPFTGRGTKTIQLVRLADGWRISAAAWHDEP